MLYPDFNELLQLGSKANYHRARASRRGRKLNIAAEFGGLRLAIPGAGAGIPRGP